MSGRSGPFTEWEAAPTTEGRRRRLLFRLRRASRVFEQRERLQEWVFGLLLAALVLALPAPAAARGSELVDLVEGRGGTSYGLVFPLAKAMSALVPTDARSALLVLAAVSYGAALTVTLATLRGLGFRRTASVPATGVAFLMAGPWLGASSPVDYAPGVLGATLVFGSLLRLEEKRPRGYQWRATFALALAFLLAPENLLLAPAVGWAIARHPRSRAAPGIAVFQFVLVLAISLAALLGGPGESARLEHLVSRVLSGAEPSLGALGAWAAWLPAAFGVGLFALYQLLVARREVGTQRAPAWVVPWCVVVLAPIVAGAPGPVPVGGYLVPAVALGLADWANRRGARRAEARAGAVALTVQVGWSAVALFAWTAWG